VLGWWEELMQNMLMVITDSLDLKSDSSLESSKSSMERKSVGRYP